MTELQRRRVRTRAAALVVGLLTTLATASPAQMAGLRTERLAEDVYAIVRTTRPSDPSDANTLVIVNAADVVVVDGNITPRSTRAVISAIKAITPKPVRYVVITHAHSDHHTGNVEYQRAYPGVEFIAHAQTRRSIIEEDIPSFHRNVRTDYPAEITRLEAVLTKGTHSTGAPLTSQERERMRAMVASMRYFIEGGTTFAPIPPALTFTDSLELVRGTRRILLKHLGVANTTGDIVVYLPNERILATGDIVVSPTPFAYGSFPFAWIGALDLMRGLDATVLLPGHGEPMRDWTYVALLHRALCATASQVKGLLQQGVARDSVVSRVSLDSLSARFAARHQNAPWIQAALRGGFTVPAVNGALQELAKDPSLSIPASCARVD